MFLLFGFRARDNVVSRRPMVCGVNVLQTLVKRSTKFTLFFIPLFPVKRSTYYLKCGNCGAARRTDVRSNSALVR